MQHKCKVTVIKKECYTDFQAQYLADPKSGPCPCYNVGDTFVFERYGAADDFWHIGLNTLKSSKVSPDGVAGGPAFPHCSEAWDAISRYIYTALQGGSIMRNWTNDERMMIACCSDGTRPVVFKIERLDYKVLYLSGAQSASCREKLKEAWKGIKEVNEVVFRSDFVEVFLEKDVDDELLKRAAEQCEGVAVTKID